MAAILSRPRCVKWRTFFGVRLPINARWTSFKLVYDYFDMDGYSKTVAMSNKRQGVSNYRQRCSKFSGLFRLITKKILKHYCPFVSGIHRGSVDSLTRGYWYRMSVRAMTPSRNCEQKVTLLFLIRTHFLKISTRSVTVLFLFDNPIK